MPRLDELRTELRLLHDLMQSRPSEDWTLERERVAELNSLIAAAREEASPHA